MDDDELEKLLEELMKTQLRANYRKSLGREYLRRNWDFEIKKALKKKD